ncbi:alpha/beta fold hydrolase [Isoptericola sediminis]|uniref:Alpha/beta hydrolase n=1 Tax=Isoptericola sediminis TaxID=2733572 RepID=A0A849K3E0_9MICO|nr:alpha/beta hydrolase [Isoptericola sediminis]NNU26295.1 alpha/beta hydrolase [Isoptericola sediminis]
MLLAHDVTGTGPHALLLHAGVADRHMWDPVMTGLSQVFRVLRPDLRGFGETPLPAEDYVDADDVAEVMDACGIEDAVVVGNSLGARVALELASRHPDRVRELVLISPAYPDLPPSAALRDFIAHEETLLDAGDLDAAVALNVDTWLGPDADEATRAALARMQHRAFDIQLAAETDAHARGAAAGTPRPVDVDLHRIHVPTLVVTGGHDMDHFRAVAARLVESIPGAELLALDWAGHLPTLENPDAIEPLLLDVLRDDPTVHAP